MVESVYLEWFKLGGWCLSVGWSLWSVGKLVCRVIKVRIRVFELIVGDIDHFWIEACSCCISVWLVVLLGVILASVVLDFVRVSHAEFSPRF